MDATMFRQTVADLDSYGGTQTKIAAASRLGRLPYFNRLAVDALTRASKDCNHDLQVVCQDSIDALFMRRHVLELPGGTDIDDPAVRDVDKDGVQAEQLDDFEDTVFCRCNFCGKETRVNKAGRGRIDKLSGPGHFYCGFCLRHGFNHGNGRNILVLTFRGIVGYYFYAHYALPKQPWMYLSQIEDYVAAHVRVGLENPLFCYDPETFCWFVDFSRVGDSKRKLPLRDVLTTVSECLMSFDIYQNVDGVEGYKVFHKFEESIRKFHAQRYRPSKQKVLAPTLFRTGASEFATELIKKLDYSYHHGYGGVSVQSEREKRRIPWEETRAFLPGVLADAIGRRG